MSILCYNIVTVARQVEQEKGAENERRNDRQTNDNYIKNDNSNYQRQRQQRGSTQKNRRVIIITLLQCKQA